MFIQIYFALNHRILFGNSTALGHIYVNLCSKMEWTVMDKPFSLTFIPTVSFLWPKKQSSIK